MGDRVISNVNRKICFAIGATDYAMILLSAYPDQILTDAYASYKIHKEDVQNAVTWIWSHARTLCKNRGIEPCYSQMLEEVKVAGYSQGDRLLLHADKESQFRYDEVRNSHGRRRDEPKRNAEKIAPPPKEVNMNNTFLAQFGVPDWVKENDLSTHSGLHKTKDT